MINLLEVRPFIDGHTITAKAESLWQTDPHGFTLTLIAVGTVFLGLIILYFIYNLSGNIFSGKYKKAREERKAKAAAIKAAAAPKATGKMNDEVAAAIAMALQMNGGEEVYAAIATALHLHISCNSRVEESFVLTIKPSQSEWGNKLLNFRKQK
ncbi:MAG: OadG family protein [Bacteroidales bacterium]|nr:OadG family protein [Bacteroidales bacterium]